MVSSSPREVAAMITYARLYEHDNEQTLTAWLSLPADVRHYVAT